MFNSRRIRQALLRIPVAVLLLLTNTFPAGVPRVSAASTCDPLVPFNRSNFSNPTRINNTWLPLVPGTQIVLEGRANRGGGSLPHRVIFTVTDLTKVINGVRSVVVWDRDINEDVLVEAELAFFAQDNDGNVWNVGEYPEEYENGQFAGAPSTWIAGLDGAEAGIHMQAQPKPGKGWYLQGIAPAIGFLDCAKVFKSGESVCVPVSCYNGVLVTEEVSPLDQTGGHQLKYHAAGVGIVQVGAVADREGETLVLVSARQLSRGEMAQARNEALRLDRHGYEVSAVYQQTPPAQ